MKHNMKKALKDAFEAPAPVRKDRFLKTIPQPGISNLYFILSQAGYIQKWTWVLSSVLFVLSFIGACFLDQDILWILSSIIPFAALSVVTENGRPAVYGMAELEMASRFSLKSILLARMGILGAAHLVLLCVLIPLSNINNASTLLQTGVYLLVPYLLTIVSGLWIVRKIHGKEAVFYCMGAAGCVSGLNMFVQSIYPGLFLLGYFHWWTAALFILTACFLFEFYQIIHQTEEAAWN